MNDDIRAAVQARLEEKHMSRADLARAMGKTPQEVTRALNGGKDGGGKIPGIWAAILEALDLRLTVEPGQGSKTGEGGQV
ncbi:helix-turn-helix domain-containing protein [Deinococcus sp. RM]|uniref:helix-turn-helix domain-containing protein n=1 Tax=Deinococcus sp. RM TaxID=2316359 RepID=UPI000E67D92B|nr:helix-turn-helix transcriptional regulator [Deinococcus sp. RM]RIY15893.1 XRE family transcriptional regulator [Deinococcus sp. RM]